eukprot:scaffold34822_cov32-Tisochrysis_lutea.AAC.8
MEQAATAMNGRVCPYSQVADREHFPSSDVPPRPKVNAAVPAVEGAVWPEALMREFGAQRVDGRRTVGQTIRQLTETVKLKYNDGALEVVERYHCACRVML